LTDPKTFWGTILYVLVFLFFVCFLASLCIWQSNGCSPMNVNLAAFHKKATSHVMEKTGGAGFGTPNLPPCPRVHYVRTMISAANQFLPPAPGLKRRIFTVPDPIAPPAAIRRPDE